MEKEVSYGFKVYFEIQMRSFIEDVTSWGSRYDSRKLNK
jgi:hypothetical protein